MGRDHRDNGGAWNWNAGRAAVEADAVNTEAACIFRSMLWHSNGHRVRTSALRVLDSRPRF